MKNNSEAFNWNIEIPKNTTGDLYVPNYKDAISVSINGKNSDIKDYNSDFTFIGSFEAGNYRIEMKH